MNACGPSARPRRRRPMTPGCPTTTTKKRLHTAGELANAAALGVLAGVFATLQAAGDQFDVSKQMVSIKKRQLLGELGPMGPATGKRKGKRHLFETACKKVPFATPIVGELTPKVGR